MTERLRYILSAEGVGQFKKDMKGVEDSTRKSGGAIQGVFKNIGTAVKAYVGVEVVRQVGRAVFSLGELSERSRVVRTSFERLASGVGDSSQKMLMALRRGTNGAVKDLDLMTQANKAILLGIPVTANKMDDLAQVAVRLGRAVGRTATESLDDLVTGIGRMSPLILDNLGITIKAEEAFRGLGEGASDADKRLAFFNAVMEKANERSEQLGDIAPSLQERWDKVNASFSNFAVTVGGKLVPALEQVAILMDKIIPKDGQTAVAEKVMGGQMIDALRAKSAGLRARGRGDEADLIDAQIRQLQNQQAQNLVTGGDPERNRATNRARVASAGLLMSGNDFSFGNSQPRQMSDMQPATEIINDLKENKNGIYTQFDDMGEYADGVFESVADNFNRTMQRSAFEIEHGFRQMGIQTNGFFRGISHGATGLRKLMPENKTAGAIQTGLDTGLAKIAGVLTPISQVAMGIQAVSGALKMIGIEIGKTTFSGFDSLKTTEDFDIARQSFEAKRGLGADHLVDEAIAEINRREAEAQGVNSGSQSFESVSRITESQADQMAGLLNSILVTNQSMDNKLGTLVQVNRNMEFFMASGATSRLVEFQGL